MVVNQNAVTTEPRGLMLWQDFCSLEKPAHFDLKVISDELTDGYRSAKLQYSASKFIRRKERIS